MYVHGCFSSLRVFYMLMELLYFFSVVRAHSRLTSGTLPTEDRKMSRLMYPIEQIAWARSDPDLPWSGHWRHIVNYLVPCREIQNTDIKFACARCTSTVSYSLWLMNLAIISTLRNLCIRHALMRHELTTSSDIFISVGRQPRGKAMNTNVGHGRSEIHPLPFFCIL